jgi:hypothetical protein
MPKKALCIKEGFFKNFESANAFLKFLISALRKALLAVYRAVAAGLERYIAFFITVRACCFMHLSGSSSESAAFIKSHNSSFSR